MSKKPFTYAEGATSMDADELMELDPSNHTFTFGIWTIEDDNIGLIDEKAHKYIYEKSEQEKKKFKYEPDNRIDSVQFQTLPDGSAGHFVAEVTNMMKNVAYPQWSGGGLKFHIWFDSAAEHREDKELIHPGAFLVIRYENTTQKRGRVLRVESCAYNSTHKVITDMNGYVLGITDALTHIKLVDLSKLCKALRTMQGVRGIRQGTQRYEHGPDVRIIRGLIGAVDKIAQAYNVTNSILENENIALKERIKVLEKFQTTDDDRYNNINME